MPTSIEWTDETWSPITGCTKLSTGCRNCYAERMARRLAGRAGYPEAPDHFKVTLHPDRLDQPDHWRKPRKIFVCSMSDLFHEDVPDKFIYEVLNTITWNGPCYLNQTEDDPVGTFWPGHIFQILTKRPERMQRIIDHWQWTISGLGGTGGEILDWYVLEYGNILPHLWLGVTAENQQAADERIPWLLKTPAAVRFVSVEPMLGPVDLTRIKWAKIENSHFTGKNELWSINNVLISDSGNKWTPPRIGLDWVVNGGETGPGARPMAWHWAESLHQQCLDADVPYFFKRAGDAFEGNPALLPSGARQWPKAVINASKE